MKRRNFLGALLAVVTGCALSTKAETEGKAIELWYWTGGDFWQMGSLSGARDRITYQYYKVGDLEYCQYMTQDRNVGLATTSPQAVLHVLESGG